MRAKAVAGEPRLASPCRRPKMKVTGCGARKAALSAWPSTAKPRGLSRSEAILARNLLAERPIDTVMPISSSTSPGEAGERLRRRQPVQPLGAGEIEERLVDRQRLDQRRQLQHQRAHLAADRGIFVHVGLDDHGVRAQPPAP